MVGGALPVAGVAVRGRAASLPALAPAGLRPGRPPRRARCTCSCAGCPGPSRPAGRRAPGVFAWRPPAALVVEATRPVRGGADDRPGHRGARPTSRRSPVPRHRPVARLRAGGGTHGGRRPRGASGWATWAVRVTRRSCSPWRWWCDRPLSGSVVVDLADAATPGVRRRPGRQLSSEVVASTDAALAGRQLGRAVRASPLRRARGRPLGSRAAGSGWPATGSRSSRWPTSCSPAQPASDDVDLELLRRSLDRLFGGGAVRRRRPAHGCGRVRADAGQRAAPAGRARARPPLCAAACVAAGASRTRRCRVALAAPTGKAAARLQAAVQVDDRPVGRDRERPAELSAVDAAPAAGLGARGRQPVPNDIV